jgi:hypothetical protein
MSPETLPQFGHPQFLPKSDKRCGYVIGKKVFFRARPTAADGCAHVSWKSDKSALASIDLVAIFCPSDSGKVQDRFVRREEDPPQGTPGNQMIRVHIVGSEATDEHSRQEA